MHSTVKDLPQSTTGLNQSISFCCCPGSPFLFFPKAMIWMKGCYALLQFCELMISWIFIADNLLCLDAQAAILCQFAAVSGAPGYHCGRWESEKALLAFPQPWGQVRGRLMSWKKIWEEPEICNALRGSIIASWWACFRSAGMAFAQVRIPAWPPPGCCIPKTG